MTVIKFAVVLTSLTVIILFTAIQSHDGGDDDIANGTHAASKVSHPLFSLNKRHGLLKMALSVATDDTGLGDDPASRILLSNIPMHESIVGKFSNEAYIVTNYQLTKRAGSNAEFGFYQ